MSRAEARISMRASSDALFVFNTPVSSNLYISSSLVRRQLDKVQDDRGGGCVRVCAGVCLHTLAYSGILWHTIAYSGIHWHTLAYIGILFILGETISQV